MTEKYRSLGRTNGFDARVVIDLLAVLASSEFARRIDRLRKFAEREKNLHMRGPPVPGERAIEF